MARHSGYTSGVSSGSGNANSKAATSAVAPAAFSPKPFEGVGRVAELDQVLSCDAQRLGTPVQFGDGRLSNTVGRVRLVGQPAQDAGIDENSHYS